MGAVRFHPGEENRVEDVNEPRLEAGQVSTGVASCGIRGTDPEPGISVPDKQVHRWVNEGGALLPHD